jgi:hypothetical protein
MPTPNLLASVRTQRRRLFWGYLVVLGLVFLISFLKGFRLPNLWAATQFAVNYSAGFVRRGLIGELARRIGGPNVFHYNTFAAIAFSILLVVSLLSALAIYRSLVSSRGDWGYNLALLVFAASPGVAFVVHTVGYLDYIGFMGVLLVILLGRRTRYRFVLFYLTLVVGSLLGFVHEVLAVMFGPVLFFVMLCHGVSDAQYQKCTTKRLVWLLWQAALVAALILVISGVIGTWGTASPTRADELHRSMAQMTNFPLRPDVFEAEARSSARSLTRLMPWYWGMVWEREAEAILPIKAWLAIFPSFAFLFGYGQVAIGQLRLAPFSTWVLRVAYAGATLAPFSLNLVGWDYNRWNGIAILACFACLLTIRIFIPSPPPRPLSPAVLTCGMIALALSLASDNVLFDGFTMQFFPFEKQYKFLHNLLLEESFHYLPRG